MCGMSACYTPRMTIRLGDGSLSHAYVIEGELVASRAALFAHLSETWGFQGESDPDLFLYATSPFGIDEARNVRERGELRPIRDRKYFVIISESVTHEAQNALLKTFEEPKPDTHFFLLVRTSAVLLPTLLSRVRIVSHVRDAGDGAGEAVAPSAFVEADIGERLAMIGKIDALRKDHPDEAKARARDLLDGIEIALAQDPSARAVLSETIDAKRRLGGRSPSLKMLLEHLALAIPRPAAPSTKK